MHRILRFAVAICAAALCSALRPPALPSVRYDKLTLYDSTETDHTSDDTPRDAELTAALLANDPERARRRGEAILGTLQRTAEIRSADHPQLRLVNQSDLTTLAHAKLGDVFLKHLWLSLADQEFRTVMATTPASSYNSMDVSISRSLSCNGLARLESLCGNYGEARRWLRQAPSEHFLVCSEGLRAVANNDYPIQAVWELAQKPFSEAEPALVGIMQGNFTPQRHDLGEKYSTYLRSRAAVEAGLTLGCLNAQRGETQKACTIWKLVAEKGGARWEASRFACRLLEAYGQPQHRPEQLARK